MTIAACGFSQPNRGIDSLKQLLNAQVTDKEKAKTMTLLAVKYLYEQDDSVHTMLYARAAFSLYARQKDSYGMADATRRIAELYSKRRHWLPAEEKYKEALHFIEKDTSGASIALRARILLNYAILAENMGAKKKAMELSFEAAAIQEKTQNYKSLRITYRNIAIQFEYGGDTAKAGNYYRKSLETAIQSKQDSLIFDSYMFNARFMLVKDDVSKAEAYLEAAKNTCRLPAKDPLWGQYFYLRANCYIYRKAYRKALSSLSRAQALINQHDQIDALNILLVRSEIYKTQKKYAMALREVREVYRLASHDTINVGITARVSILMGLVDLEEKNGHFKEAYAYLQEKLALDHRVNMQEMPLKFQELELKYQTAQKDKDLLLLQNRGKQQEIRLQENRILNIGLFSGLGILALLIALLFILFYNRRKLAGKKEIIYEQQIEALKKEQQLISYEAILEGQEQERSRLARDLHDGLNGILSGIVMQLSAFSRNSKGTEKASHLDRIIGRMNEAVSEVRAIAHNLMPNHLARLGLDNSLKDLCNTLRSGQADIVYRSYALSDAIPQQQQVLIYRMIQELVVNAVKHAHAKTILVECLQDGEMLHITVEDDGQGFSPESVEHKSGMGLENIKKRVAFLKGTIEVLSLPGTGTTIHIQCPLK